MRHSFNGQKIAGDKVDVDYDTKTNQFVDVLTGVPVDSSVNYRYIATTGEEITENSVPDLDDWGWDDYWTCSDWTAWHKIVKDKKGKETADSLFLRYWNLQGALSHALNCRTFNSDFRDYTRKEGLLSKLYDGAPYMQPFGVGTDVINTAGDVINAATDTVSTTAKILKYAIPVALVGAMVYGAYYIFKKTKI